MVLSCLSTALFGLLCFIFTSHMGDRRSAGEGASTLPPGLRHLSHVMPGERTENGRRGRGGTSKRERVEGEVTEVVG